MLTYLLRLQKVMLTGLMVMLLVFPTGYLLGADCQMMAETKERQDLSGCCPDSGNRSGDNDNESGSDNKSDNDSESPSTGDPSSASSSNCLSCMDCGCVFVPFTSTSGSAAREATQQQTISIVPELSGEQMAHFSRRADKTKPLLGPFPGPVPIYLKNQVFLN